MPRLVCCACTCSWDSSQKQLTALQTTSIGNSQNNSQPICQLAICFACANGLDVDLRCSRMQDKDQCQNMHNFQSAVPAGAPHCIAVLGINTMQQSARKPEMLCAGSLSSVNYIQRPSEHRQQMLSAYKIRLDMKIAYRQFDHRETMQNAVADSFRAKSHQ